MCIQLGVHDEFENYWGYSFEAKSGPFYEDLVKVFQKLKIVKNNNVTSVGGGGKTLQPISPPICV